ncbi:SH3-like domain-containing protein [Albidovulum inexpectatum]|uniref:SH3-like domain-containing protein n=2 Tax=Albidovulum inexpectatum TaxID=196587 RepID=A0A2S5JES9_9RHOB|nr:SH3-like domain-containing protein [Albidovulum inexpectatum]
MMARPGNFRARWAIVWGAIATCLALIVPAIPVTAQQSGGETTQMSQTRRGPVTNLPLPRFVSLKASKANVRRGPGLNHRIDWVFQHRGMPLLVTAEYGHWRRVEDQEGQGGWIYYTMLSGVRTVSVTRDDVRLMSRPDPESEVVARARLGAIARLGECVPGWCRITADGIKGWVPRDAIWGVAPDEMRQ